MEVTLLNTPTLAYIDSGVGKCWAKGAYGNTAKGLERINRVCNKNQHSSMLRFANYIFDIKISTSVLLELSRHQVGINLAMQSTRYCLKNNDIDYERSKSEPVNFLMDFIIKQIREFIKANPNISNDDLKLLLPQSVIYNGQIQFNGQSLQHFLKLRTHKTSHYQIREFALALFNALPEDHKFLHQDYVQS